MSTPTETLQADIRDAMRAKEKERLTTLRMLLAAVKNAEIDNQGKALDEAGFVATVRRLVKQRKDSVTQYRQGGRDELADKEEREIEILSVYLPAQADEATLRAAILEVVEAQGLEGPKGIGPIMKAMMQRFGAAADGGTINRIARDILNSRS